MGLFSSLGGSYLVQSIFHSFIIALVVEALLKTWRLRKPQTELRFRLLILVFPLFGWPLYQLVHRVRGSQAFRDTTALLDLNQWLGLEVGGVVPLWYALVFLMALAIALFLTQEVVPTVRHRRRRFQSLKPIQAGQFPKLDRALAEVAQAINCPRPQLFSVNLSEPAIYVTGVIHPALVLSLSLLDLLDDEELEGVLAHEMAHLLRRDSQVGWVLLVLRSLLFYNPVALFAFRRITQDTEKVCDDMAVMATGKPLALASGLVKVFREGQPRSSSRERARRLRSWAELLDSRARRAQAEDRVASLAHPSQPQDIPYKNLRLALTAAAMAALLFFVV